MEIPYLLYQAYYLTAIVGSAYLVFSAFMGHGLHSGDGGSGGHGGHGGHGAEPGHSGQSGHDAHDPSEQMVRNVRLVSGARRMNAGHLLLNIFSPLTISCLMAFFGIFGLILARTMPFLGMLTAVGAFICSVVVTKFFLFLFSFCLSKLETNSSKSINDVIGHVAEVTVPLDNGHTGEVVYSLGQSRLNAPARPAREGLSFKRGTKVMVIDVQGNILFVEPIEDLFLEDLTGR